MRGEHVEVGMAIRFLGRSYVVTRIERYEHRIREWPEAWTAYADDDGWKMTLFRGTPVQVVS